MNSTPAKTLITKTDIISAIAYWAIKQSPYLFPKNLQAALEAVEKRIDEKNIFDTPDKNACGSMEEIENAEIIKLVKDLIFNTHEVQIWNVTQVEQDNGITKAADEKRTVKFGATSRLGPMQEGDHSFIDLDALRQNVCEMILK